jgi:hypothetical protein
MAQPVKEVPPYMNIEVAEEHLAMKDYYRALEYYEIAYKQERSEELAYKIGMLHFKLRDYARAERWLSRVIENDKNGIYSDAVLTYARTLKMNSNYAEAIEAYNVYANMVQSEELLLVADVEVAGIQMAVKAEEPIELVVTNISTGVDQIPRSFTNTTLSLFGEITGPSPSANSFGSPPSKGTLQIWTFIWVVSSPGLTPTELSKFEP